MVKPTHALHSDHSLINEPRFYYRIWSNQVSPHPRYGNCSDWGDPARMCPTFVKLFQWEFRAVIYDAQKSQLAPAKVSRPYRTEKKARKVAEEMCRQMQQDAVRSAAHSIERNAEQLRRLQRSMQRQYGIEGDLTLPENAERLRQAIVERWPLPQRSPQSRRARSARRTACPRCHRKLKAGEAQ